MAISSTNYSRIALDQEAFYPVKIVSRAVTRRRMRRMSSYIMSAGLAIVCISTLSPNFTIGAWKTVQQAPSAGMAALAPGIVVAAPAHYQNQHEAASAPSAVYPLTLALKIESGDTLTTILTDAGVSYDEAQRAVDAIDDVYDVRRIDAGQDISLRLDKPADAPKPIITDLNLVLSATTSLHLVRHNSEFAVKKTEIPMAHKIKRAGGTIESSLYETGVSSGIPASMLEQIIAAYSYDVDFQRDIQPGNKIDVLFDRLESENGAVAGHGDVLFADLDLGDRSLRIYRFTDKNGFTDYYNEKGESVRKALMRTPINGARISSGFGMRNHPILGYSRMHRGIDFAAPVGTPIYAAGDGVVEYAGIKGGYGNYLRIKHNGTYASAYGHISRFASGMRPGQHVKQGQIVAYVGMTGMATGPHLHYEILINNEQVNPANVKFKTGGALQGKELQAFRANMKHLEEQLAATPQHDGSKLAMNVR